jgi:hypothetical protein
MQSWVEEWVVESVHPSSEIVNTDQDAVLSWMRWNFTPPETNFPHME